MKPYIDSGDLIRSGIECFVAEHRYDDAFGRKIIALATSTFLTQRHWLCAQENLQVNQHLFGVGDKLESVNPCLLTFTGDALVTVHRTSGVQVHDRRHLWQPPRLCHETSEITAR